LTPSGTGSFARNESGDVFHSYSTSHRGDELPMGAFMWLDLTPKGRNTAERHAPDVRADERRPFRTLAAADRQPTKRCPPVLIRRSPDRAVPNLRSR
jgi:hypothetical protein